MNNENSNTVAIRALIDECYFPNKISAMTGVSKDEIIRIERDKDGLWGDTDDGFNRDSYHSNQSNRWFL